MVMVIETQKRKKSFAGYVIYTMKQYRSLRETSNSSHPAPKSKKSKNSNADWAVWWHLLRGGWQRCKHAGHQLWLALPWVKTSLAFQPTLFTLPTVLQVCAYSQGNGTCDVRGVPLGPVATMGLLRWVHYTSAPSSNAFVSGHQPNQHSLYKKLKKPVMFWRRVSVI